jgi:two-component system sensor histidine kinase YesM
MKLRTRLLLGNFILIVLPLVILSTFYYRTGSEAVTKQARENVFEIVKKNNEVLDDRLKRIEYDSQLLEADRKITAILGRQFSQYADLYAYQLWTSYYTFGHQRSMPQGDPSRTISFFCCK